MRSPAPVLVTDAPANASLAVVRSLGRRGIPVGVWSWSLGASYPTCNAPFLSWVAAI